MHNGKINKTRYDDPSVGKYMLCYGKINGSTSFAIDNMYYVSFKIWEQECIPWCSEENSKENGSEGSKERESPQRGSCWKNTCLHHVQNICSGKITDLLHSQLITCTM